MLSQLDTVIGFIVVMSIVSLLIMVVTQICSSFLGLRGGNLADALETLFHRLAPNIHVPGCRILIDDALTDPAISDSILSTRKEWGFWLRRFGFLRRLRLRWMRATAVRPDELYELLRDKAAGPVAAALDAIEKKDAELGAALAALAAPRSPLAVAAGLEPGPSASAAAPLRARLEAASASLRSALDGLHSAGRGGSAASPAPANRTPIVAAVQFGDEALGSAEEALRALGVGLGIAAAETLRPVNRLAESLVRFDSEAKKRAALASSIAARQICAAVGAETRAAQIVTAAAGDAGRAAAAETARFEKWFNSAQDRAQQWFGTHTRIVTIIAAILAAFVLQLDTFELVRLLASNPDVRARLVARADALQRQSESSRDQQFTPAVHRQAIQDIEAAHRDWRLPGGIESLPAGRDLAGARVWLRDRLKGSPQAEEVLDDYEIEVDRLTLSNQVEEFMRLRKDNALGSLQLMPDPYPIEANPSWSRASWWHSPFVPWTTEHGVPRAYWSWPLPHLLGILFSAALLSLGGPFWFSLLKQISSLRPALAEAVDNQPRQATVPPPPVPPTN